jgi:predicted kinase
MKFVMLNGHSCSGKSTVVKRIIAEKDQYYQLSYDSLKWLFSKYSREAHSRDVQKLVQAVAESVCAMRYNIICDSALHKETRDLLLEIPRRHEYEIIEINLEADYEILARRFDVRIADALRNPERKISNLSKDRFNELYRTYEEEKNPNVIIIRTDMHSIDEVANKVLALIQ